jgi:endonuclease-3
MAVKTNWSAALKPLLKKYKGKKHPLDYHTIYQLLVMTILAARDADRRINERAPKIFESYPDMKALSKADVEDLKQLIKGIVNYRNKANWLIQLAQTIQVDKNIPLTLDAMIKLPGIGRKSANVIMHEAKAKPEGVIVDLHVVRVAPRLGIATGTNAEKIEKQLMEALPQKEWGDAGMAISFLGRETCRPQKPKCSECLMPAICLYYKNAGAK